ncbi:MAG: hypothetical protein AAFN06_05315 [Pseudomonadota bacterium]
MNDEFSEERIQELVKHGEKTLNTAKLITNWCGEARITRSGGRGLVEAMYNVPIGHSGVGCDHARSGGLMCWDLEEAFLNHYLKNCKTCKHRKPGIGTDMQPVIDKFEASRAAKKAKQEERQKSEEEALQRRRHERSGVFSHSDPTEVEIRSFLDEIDESGDREAKRRLLELARLAPEAFSGKIADYFYSVATVDQGRLQYIAADVFLTFSGDVAAKLDVALATCGYGLSDLVANFLEDNATAIPPDQVKRIIGPVAYRAVSFRSVGNSSRPANPTLLLALAASHPSEIKDHLTNLLNENEEQDVEIAACIITKITSKHPELTKHCQRPMLAKLLRRRHLLPDLGDRGMSEGLNRLRSAAAALFNADPEACDVILRSLGEGADETAIDETARIHSEVLRTSFNGPVLDATPARRIAFKRLLWAAVGKVGKTGFDEATHFFWNADSALINVASDELDAIFGAAALLSQADQKLEKTSSIETPKTGLDLLTLQTSRNAIDRLQGALIQWVFMVSRHQGQAGIKRVLDLYANTPTIEVQFRANIVAHLSELITDTETMNIVLPYIYSGMTNADPLIRGSAATAIGEASYDIRRDFPDLVFEVYLALLTDPNVYVHRSAVRALKTYSFPEVLKQNLKAALFNLIRVYYHETERSDFLVLCLGEFANAFLTDTEVEGGLGRMIVQVIDSMPDYSACQAIERMPFSMGKAPGYAELVAKLLASEDAREFMREKLYRALFHTPREALANCAEHIVQAQKSSNPYRLRVPLALLAKGGAYGRATSLCDEALETLPDTREQKHARGFLQCLRMMSKFEETLPKTETDLKKARANWDKLLVELKREKELDDAERGLPPVFFG